MGHPECLWNPEAEDHAFLIGLNFCKTPGLDVFGAIFKMDLSTVGAILTYREKKEESDRVLREDK